MSKKLNFVHAVDRLRVAPWVRRYARTDRSRVSSRDRLEGAPIYGAEAMTISSMPESGAAVAMDVFYEISAPDMARPDREGDIEKLVAAAARDARNAAHEMDAEWCEHGAQLVWKMMKDQGPTPTLQTIFRVCQIFASTIRDFKNSETA